MKRRRSAKELYQSSSGRNTTLQKLTSICPRVTDNLLLSLKTNKALGYIARNFRQSSVPGRDLMIRPEWYQLERRLSGQRNTIDLQYNHFLDGQGVQGFQPQRQLLAWPIPQWMPVVKLYKRRRQTLPTHKPKASANFMQVRGRTT